MRRLIVALCAATAFSAVAADDLMSAYYGNTWEYKDSEGAKLLRLNADGSFQMVHFNGNEYGGKWDIKGRTVCFHVGQDASCFDDIAGRKLGEQWTGPHDGETYKGRIYAGHEAPDAKAR